MPQFILFMRGGTVEFRKMSPEKIQEVIQKYENWARLLMQQGKLHGGEKLRDDGSRVVRMQNDQLVVDGPFPETKETIGGYYVIEAADYAQAIQVAKGSPIYAYGGSVEVREIEPR